MCKVLDARERRGEIRGVIKLHELMRILAEKGYQIDEVLKMTSEEKAREKLYQEYGIA